MAPTFSSELRELVDKWIDDWSPESVSSIVCELEKLISALGDPDGPEREVNTEGLLPCPCCGDPDPKRQPGHCFLGPTNAIWCWGCGLELNLSGAESLARVTDKWNQRAAAVIPAPPEKLIDDLLAKTFEFIGLEEDDEMNAFPGRGLRRMRDLLRRLQESEPGGGGEDGP